MKTTNAGTYRIDKYGARKKNKYIVVLLTSDVRTKKLLKIDVYVQGEKSEREVVENDLPHLLLDTF